MTLLKGSLLAAAVLLAGVPHGGSAEPMPAVVHIRNFAFVPAALAVAPGTTVTFVNDDQEPHTVTATDHAFDSDGLDTHQTWTHVFPKAGTYTYFCEMHPYMHGTIVVKAVQ